MKKITTVIEYGFICFFFLLPLQTRWIVHQGILNGVPWEYGTFSIYGTEVLLWLVVVLSVLYSSLGFLLRTTRLGSSSALAGLNGSSALVPTSSGHLARAASAVLFLRRNPSLAILTFVATASIFWSLDRGVAFRAWLTLAEGMALFCILKSVPLSRARLVYAFLAGMTLQAGLAIEQFSTQTTFASTFLGMALHDSAELGTSVVQTATERFLRAYGTLPHPNILGGYLVVAITLLLSSKFKVPMSNQFQSSNVKKYFLTITYYVLVALFTTALFFTFSRGAWVALLVGLILLMLYERGFVFTRSTGRSPNARDGGGIARSTERSPGACGPDACRDEGDGNQWSHSIRRNRVACLSLVAITIFFTLSIIFWQPFSTRIFSTERLEVASTQERITSLNDAFAIIRESPFLGVGIGNATVALQQKYPTQNAWSIQPPHNIFVLILLELGVVGLILFLLFLFFLFRLYPIPYTLYPFLILGLFDHYLWSLYAGVILFWAICGLASSTTSDAKVI